MSEKPQPSFFSPSLMLYAQVGLAFILTRLVLYTYTAWEPQDREAPHWFLIKFSLMVAFLLCISFQALS
jgi:hypothetical protein